MKIGFLAGTLGRGGAERQLVFMLRALRNAGIESRVLSLRKNEALESEITDAGFEVDWIGSSERKITRLSAIIRNLSKQPVDIIQSAHFFTNLYVGIAGRRLSIPAIGAIRNDLTSELNANGIFGKWQLKMPRHLIANSQIAVDRAMMNGIDPAHIDLVKNVVESVDRQPKDPGSADKSDTSILFAGRLVAQKRPEEFIKLAAELKKSFPGGSLRFIVAGGGPLLPTLKTYAHDLSLSESEITFLGEVSDMSQVYPSADILVLTSKHEGTPNVVLEAMAQGVPVVATNVGGVHDLLGQTGGQLADPNSFGDLVKCTEKYIRDPAMRREVGEKSRDFVAKNHSIGYLQDRLINIYSKLSKGRL